MAARWNYRHVRPGRVAPDSPLALFLGDRGRIVDLDELRAGAGDYDEVTVPDFAAADPDAWLIVPLLHIDQLAGFVVLQQSLARRSLNWEDFDLLRTVGRQAASYIAEQSSQAALAEAQKFDEFNRRFAFIMHDIKNLVSQLSLVARNAERHADNPEFRADMVATLQSSVGKMNDLLARLSQHNTAKPELPARADLGAILAEVASAKKRAHAPVDLALADDRVEVTADAGRLEQVFAHLVQNAIDASPAGSPVRVALSREGRSARVSVEDAGTGMSAAFVRNELFRPFRSTKAGGFGIGAYEAREIVRSLGGRLDVASREGEGTVFTVTLPLIPETERTPA
jgi:putative PEP-CTERM system histidine kinase